MPIHRFTRLFSLTLALLPVGLAAHAQSPETKPYDCSKLPTQSEKNGCIEARREPKTIYLQNVSNQNDANEILVAVRNVFEPELKLYLQPSQNAIVVSTYPEEFARIEALVRTLDRPHKTFRITYTITELDAGKAIGVEHFSMVVVDGQRTTVKEGNKIPVATGSFSTDNNSSQTQFTYLDIGMNFDATLNSTEGGAFLKTKVEQSSLGTPSTIAGVQEPVVRQTVLEGNSFLAAGKPVMLGSVDVPNTTHRFDIAVVMGPVQ